MMADGAPLVSPIRFGRISELAVGDEHSWDAALFLTFDLDWAHDEVVADTLGLLEAQGVAATIFVTHDTPLLARMRRNPKIELGIHPNYTPLLGGDPRLGASIDEVLDRIMAIVPEAISVRSHSVTNSSRIVAAAIRRGLRFDSNAYIPYASGVVARPWTLADDGIVEAPFCFADDVQATSGAGWGAAPLLAHDGLRVLCFHPIHIFLNTDTTARYEAARPHLRDPGRLREFVNRDGPGARTLLLELIASGTPRPPKTGR